MSVTPAHYGLLMPGHPWPEKAECYAPAQAACEAGAAAKIANGQMYERLLGTTQRPDILTVLHNLQEASLVRFPALRV